MSLRQVLRHCNAFLIHTAIERVEYRPLSESEGLFAVVRSDQEGMLSLFHSNQESSNLIFSDLVATQHSYVLVTSINWIYEPSCQFSILAAGRSDGRVILFHLREDQILSVSCLDCGIRERVLHVRVASSFTAVILYPNSILTTIPLSSSQPSRVFSYIGSAVDIATAPFKGELACILFGSFYAACFPIPQTQVSSIRLGSYLAQFRPRKDSQPSHSIIKLEPSHVLSDPGRMAQTVALHPRSSGTVCIADNLGRVSLMRIPDLVVLKIFKGFRNAAVGIFDHIAIHSTLRGLLEVISGKVNKRFELCGKVRLTGGLIITEAMGILKYEDTDPES